MPPPSPAIRVKLPPSRPVVSSSSQKPEISQSSSQVKQEVKKVNDPIPSVPSTPRKNNNPIRNGKNDGNTPPNRRQHGHRRFRHSSNQIVEATSPTPFKKTPSKTKDLVSPALTSPSISNTSDTSGTTPNSLKKKTNNNNVPAPTSASKQEIKVYSGGRRKNLKTSPSKPVTISKKDDDPFKYQDPLLSTSTTSLLSSSCNLNNAHPFSNRTNEKQKKDLKDEENEYGVAGEGHGVADDSFDACWMEKGCDDSGCAFEWEGSSYSGRARTTSLDSSIFTSTTASTFTGSSSSSSCEDGTEIDTSPLNDVFYASTAFEGDHLFFDERVSSFIHGKVAFPSEAFNHEQARQGDGGRADPQNALKLALGVLEEEHDEDEDDFPLSMLEKNLRGIIDEPFYYPDGSPLFYEEEGDDLFPSSPTLRFSPSNLNAASLHLGETQVRTRTPEDRQGTPTSQRFIGASPFPLPPPTVRNALESFESKLELSKKKSYPFLSSSSSGNSSSTSATSSSRSTFFSSTSPTFQIRDNYKMPVGATSMEKNGDEGRKSEVPLCRCGCGEEDLSASSFTSSSAFIGDGIPVTPGYSLGSSSAMKTSFSTGNLHKSIWSISSPPTSPTKNKTHRTSTINTGPGNASLFGIEHDEDAYGSTYCPAEDYRFPLFPSSEGMDSPIIASRPTLKRAVSSYLPNEGYSSHLPYYYHDTPHSAHHATHAEVGPRSIPRSFPPQQQHHHRFYSQQMHAHAFGPSPNNKKGELYKTEMCRSWSEIGSCRYAEKCQFAHGLEELRPMPSHYFQHGHHGYDHARAHAQHQGQGNQQQQQPYGMVERHQLSKSTPYMAYRQLPHAHTRGYSYPDVRDHYQGAPSTPVSASIHHAASSSSAYKMHGFESDMLLNGRRRSVSSPSKVRMYSITRSNEAKEVEFGGVGWKGDGAFNADNLHFSPFNMPETPRRARTQHVHTPHAADSVKKEQSLFAALPAEAANAPAPSFALCK